MLSNPPRPPIRSYFMLGRIILSHRSSLSTNYGSTNHLSLPNIEANYYHRERICYSSARCFSRYITTLRSISVHCLPDSTTGALWCLYWHSRQWCGFPKPLQIHQVSTATPIHHKLFTPLFCRLLCFLSYAIIKSVRNFPLTETGKLDLGPLFSGVCVILSSHTIFRSVRLVFAEILL